MNQDQIKKILQAISDSRVLDPDQKRVLVNIFPSLSDEQKLTLAAFLERETADLAAIDAEYEKKKAPLYQEYLATLTEAIKTADRQIATESERSADAKEEEDMSNLLNQL